MPEVVTSTPVGVAMFYDVESEEEGVAEGGGDAVVGWRGPGEKVDSGGVEGAGDVAGGRDGDCEEGGYWCHDWEGMRGRKGEGMVVGRRLRMENGASIVIDMDHLSRPRHTSTA